MNKVKRNQILTQTHKYIHNKQYTTKKNNAFVYCKRNFLPSIGLSFRKYYFKVANLLIRFGWLNELNLVVKALV